jgi:putative transposase
MHLGHKIKLLPDAEQVKFLRRCAGVKRSVFNWALAYQFSKLADKSALNKFALNKHFNSIKYKEKPWVVDVSKAISQVAINDAVAAFWAWINGNSGKPKFKSKGRKERFRPDDGTSSTKIHALKINNRYVWLPKCKKPFRLAEKPRFEGRIIETNVSLEADGWYISLLFQTEHKLERKADLGAVGVDLGLKTFAVLSDGGKIELASKQAHEERIHKKIRKTSRSLSRKAKGSANRAKARTKLARLHQKMRCTKQAMTLSGAIM